MNSRLLSPWLPGIGPLVVARSVTSMLLGGIKGAVAGRFLGIAHCPEGDVRRPGDILAGSKADQLEVHAPAA